MSVFIIPRGTGLRYVGNALSMSASRRFVFGRKSSSENPDASHPATPWFTWEAPALHSTISAFRVEHFLLLLLQPQICQPACTQGTHLQREQLSSWGHGLGESHCDSSEESIPPLPSYSYGCDSLTSAGEDLALTLESAHPAWQ